MLEQGNIQIYEELGVILGYYEIWKLNKSQLNTILMGDLFCPLEQDVNNGEIAYLANVWIDKNFRNGRIFKNLHKRFLEQAKGCRLVMGEQSKQNAKIKVFKLRRE